MWRRDWFFWMEKLQITAGEQRVILGLILTNLLVTGFVLFGPKRTLYDASHYKPVIEEFKRLSGIQYNERSALLARYYPSKEKDQIALPFLEKLAALNAGEGTGLFFHPSGSMLQMADGTKRQIWMTSEESETSKASETSEVSKTSETAKMPESTSDGRVRSLVNIQKAGPEALIALPGIGPVTAGRIIAYREENGPFRTPDDLLNVSGIGPVTLERIREFIILEDPVE